MARWALINDTIVKQVIEANDDFIEKIQSKWMYCVQDDNGNVGVGDTYDPVTKKLTRQEKPVAKHKPKRRLSSAAWWNRWTDEEIGKYVTLSATNEGVSGWLYWMKTQTEVNLDEERIRSRLQEGVSGGYITQDRMDALLADG